MTDHHIPAYGQETWAIHNRLFFRIFQLGNTLERQATKELGVSAIQWSVLGALSRKHVTDGMPFSELAEYLVVSRQNLDGVLKRLERDEHVCRVPDPNDRRVKLVLLTARGRAFWLALEPKIYKFYEQSVEGFKFDDKISFVHYVNRLNEGLKNVDLSERPATEP